VDALDRFGIAVQKIANVLRFERFWRDKIKGDVRVTLVPTFNKQVGKKPIWNIALNWIKANSSSGTIVEFGTNNGGWLKYFADHLPRTFHLTGFDCFEGLPEAWDGLPAGSIKGFGAPVELFDPFKTISFDPKKFGVDDAEQMNPTAAVAVGLALRRAGDR